MVEQPLPLLVLDSALMPVAQEWGQQLQLVPQLLPERRSGLESLLGLHEAALVLDADGLALQALEQPLPGPVRVDFVQGTLRWRLAHGGGQGEMVAKACGVSKGRLPNVLDGTAGLGRDAFILASLGCHVRLCERSPVIAALLQDGMARATRDVELAAIMSRMQLMQGDTLSVLIALAAGDTADCPDVVYLDPMFPHREKSALVKKEMRVFRHVVGEDTDADDLLPAALAVARKRVVVKRPRHAPDLAGHKPSLVVEGKSGRFDVYLVVNK